MSTKNVTDPTVGSPIARTDAADHSVRRESPGDAAKAEDRAYTHLLTVLSVSSGMVGVCLTAIGLIGIIKSLNKVEVLVDDLLAVSTLMFMFAAVLSFLGLRSGVVRRWRHFERTLDLIFCLGLVLVVVATVLLTWVVL
jgi:hypothetical protein